MFDEAAIEPRQWLYGKHYLRRFVSVLASAGGVGKTSMQIVEALAMVTGRPLLGEEVHAPCKVWLINLEDPMDEMQRRILAAMRFYDIKPELFGQGTIRVTNANEFVGQNGNTKLPQRYWDGVWVSLDGRLPGNIKVGGGIDTGKQVANGCFTVDVPNTPVDITGTAGGLNFYGNLLNGEGSCNVVTKWMDNTDFRFNGSIPIKGGFNGSFIYRNTRGAARG